MSICVLNRYDNSVLSIAYTLEIPFDPTSTTEFCSSARCAGDVQFLRQGYAWMLDTQHRLKSGSARHTGTENSVQGHTAQDD